MLLPILALALGAVVIVAATSRRRSAASQAPAAGSLRVEQRGVRRTLTVPAGVPIFTPGAPPWIVDKAALLGLNPGETFPQYPVYRGAGPMAVRSWYANDLTKGLGDSAAHGPVPEGAIVARLALGRQFVPAKGGAAVALWSTWHEGLLRSLSALFASWNREAQNDGLALETAYASEAFGAMADALGAVDTSSGSPKINEDDPVFERANAYTATLVDWLRDHEEDIIEGIVIYAATGYVAPAIASTLGAAAAGAAYLGPIGIIGVSVAILALAVYAYVTGARPGTTRGAGDDVLAFPRSAVDVDHVVFLRPVDVDAYTHSLYRSVLLDRQRRAR